VGEWLAPGKPGPADTTLLRFAPTGSARESRLGPGQAARDVALGPFRVWADTGRVRMVCFSTRRGRAEPGCRYFAVDSLLDGSGRARRRLRFFNWVTERGGAAAETWIERTP